MKRILLVSSFLITSSFGQVEFTLSTGINHSLGTNPFSNFLTDYYYPGFNFGVSANYFVQEKLSISPFTEYSNYLFNSYNKSAGGIPEISFVSASGASSQFYKLGLNIKLYPSFNPLPQGYVFTGFCWNIVNPGDITIKNYDFNNGYFNTSQTVEVKNYLTQTIGFGISFFEFNSFGFGFEGILYTNYSNRTFGSGNIIISL